MIFTTTKRIYKEKIIRITVPYLAMKIFHLKAHDELICTANEKTKTLYYHPSKFVGPLEIGHLYYSIGVANGCATVMLPKDYCKMVPGDSPFITVYIDTDKWIFRVTPEEKACNQGDV